MRILLGISALVLIAILWAMFSILRHIRIARRRNQFLRDQRAFADRQPEATPLPQSAPPPLTALPLLPPRFAAPVLQSVDAAQRTPASSVAAAQKRADTAQDQPAPQSMPSHPTLAPQSLRILEFVPEPTPPQIAEPERTPLARRPVRSIPPMRPAMAASGSGRPAWDYFNKDMGDLSDPTPSRIRDRVRPR